MKHERNIVIIEPHIDDSLLSCSTRLLSQDFDRIYNICFYTADDRDILNYKVKLNNRIIPIVLPLSEIHFKHGETFSLDGFIQGDVFENITYESIRGQFDSYELVLTSVFSAVSALYIPCGIYHPHHIIANKLVSEFIAERFKEKETYIYFDQPYSFNFPKHFELALSRNDIHDFHSKKNIESVSASYLKSKMLECFDPCHLTDDELNIDCVILYKRQR